MVQPHLEICDRISSQLHVIGRTKVGEGHSDVTPGAVALLDEREGASDALIGVSIEITESGTRPLRAWRTRFRSGFVSARWVPAPNTTKSSYCADGGEAQRTSYVSVIEASRTERHDEAHQYRQRWHPHGHMRCRWHRCALHEDTDDTLRPEPLP